MTNDEDYISYLNGEPIITSVALLNRRMDEFVRSDMFKALKNKV